MDATTRGLIVSKIVDGARTLLEDMATTSNNWSSERLTTRVASLHGLDEVAALKSQMATLTNTLVNFLF